MTHLFPPPNAIMFDRDGTLVVDVPYNGDPDRVEPMPAARATLDGLRSAGIPVGILSNQAGVARGLLTRADVWSVNGRIEALLGPFDVMRICPHAPEARCRCRKPEPGMIIDAARQLGLQPSELAYVGDIGADVQAAQAAGAVGVLVPTEATLRQEIDQAPFVAEDLREAVDLLLASPVEVGA